MNSPKVLLMTSKVPHEDLRNPDSFGIPLGLHVLRQHLNKNGIHVDVIDFALHSEQLCLNNVAQGMYDIIGMSVTDYNVVSDLGFLWKLREVTQNLGKNCLFIAGGFSATLDPRRWLKGGFDLVCLGHARETLLEICQRIAQQKIGQVWELCHDLEGVVFYNESGQEVFKTARTLSQEDFVQTMFVDFMDIDMPYCEYWDYVRRRTTGALNFNRRSFVVENSRLFTISRCLANCGFCDIPGFFPAAQGSKGGFIALSAQQVHELIVHDVHKYGARAFSFNDEDFLVGSPVGIRRTIELCELVAESKRKGEIPEDVKFSCQTRAANFLNTDINRNKSVNHDVLKAMKKVNFHNVSLGCETFIDRLIQSPSINKGDVTSADYHTVFRAFIDYGLFPTINLILGIPEMTPAELIDTIRRAVDYLDKPCQLSVATQMMAFPGAAIYKRKDYPTIGAMWTNPGTNQVTYVPSYFKPHDETMAALFSRLDEAAFTELENLKADHNWDDSRLVPRAVIALCTFRAAVKFLGENDLLQSINEKLQYLITQTTGGRDARREETPAAAVATSF